MISSLIADWKVIVIMGQNKAIVIGINQYKEDPLEYCVNDAQEVAAALEIENYNFKVTQFTDASATRFNILRELDATRLTKPSIFLFYFSGHGCATDTGTYLVTQDTQPYNEGIDLDLLAKIFDQYAKEGSVVVAIFDCCHSGAASPGVHFTRSITAADVEQALPAMGRSRVVLAACKSSESSYEDDAYKHGLFTYHLIGGLLGDAADYEGIITATSLYEYVCRPFEEQTKQTPVFKADVEGRLVLATGLSPRLGKPVGEEVMRQLEAQARSYLEDYSRRTNLGFDVWRQSGYRAACQALFPIVRWFESRIKDYPDLKNKPSFIQLRDAAMARVAHLGKVDPGTELKEGNLEKRLGEGAFGSVWKVVPADVTLPTLAYKIYNPNELSITDKVSRFKRGYQAMEQLDHPHIVKVQGFTECPVGFFMDYINGPNLRERTSGSEEPATVIELLTSVAETIRHAHGRDVIHRDIKPENIIVQHDAEKDMWIPYLTDFDLAWFPTATQFTKDAMGTLSYAAPEQLTSKNARTIAVDVFSFGQLAFFAATGSDPAPLGAGDNNKALQRRLQAWSISAAAREFYELYVECTRYDASKREKNYDGIIDRLASIKNALRFSDPSLVVTPEQFLDEVAFSLVGFDAGQPGNQFRSFMSSAGRTRLTLSTHILRGNRLDLKAEITLNDALMVEGIKNSEARKALNRKIDAALREYQFVQRTSGQQGSFEVFLEFRALAMNVNGIDHCRSVLDRTIAAIEN